MDIPQITRFLENRLKEGIGLFTGAGFSLGAEDRRRRRLPLGSELAEEIWPIAYPGEPFEKDSRLGDIFDIARRKSRNELTKYLRERLTVLPETIPDWYAHYVAVPWTAIYTLNVDNLWEAFTSRFTDSRNAHLVSGTSNPHGTPTRASDLAVYHLNGTIDDMPAKVTFSTEDYATRLNFDDPIYDRFRREFGTRVFIFIGAELDEPSLWKYIQVRDPKGSAYGTKEQRPKSFIVMPRMARARQDALSQYNIEHVALSAEEFALQVLAPLQDKARDAFERQMRRRFTEGRERIATVQTLIAHSNMPSSEPRKFLMGREPFWADIVGGKAIHRHFEDEWLTAIKDALAHSGTRLFLITGTAGDGKSTSAMQVATQLSAETKEVGWISGQDGITYQDISRLILQSQPLTVLFVDNAELIRTELVSALLARIRDGLLKVAVVVIRSGRAAQYIAQVHPEDADKIFELNTKPLNDGDIASLLLLLEDQNMLGELGRVAYPARVEIFRRSAERQLLVAMLEATEGRDFHATIRSEYIELDPVSREIYCVTAVATTIQIALTEQEILSTLPDAPMNEILNGIVTLTNRGLLARRGAGFATRHRQIAQSVRDNLKDEKHLSRYYYLLARMSALALQTTQGRDLKRRLMRVLRHAINHKILLDFMDLVALREFFESLEGLLKDEPHYWLQRASFEVEKGDLDLAKNQIENALRHAPRDPLVVTTSAYVDIKRGLAHINDATLKAKGEDGFLRLFDLIDRSLEKDSHAFHIVGSQGLSWSRKFTFTNTPERKALLGNLLKYVERGCQKYPGSGELERLRVDLKREALTL